MEMDFNVVGQSLQTQLKLDENMDLSQIELRYRAEGNANLVLALPQFKKVLRLPKTKRPKPKPNEQTPPPPPEPHQHPYPLQFESQYPYPQHAPPPRSETVLETPKDQSETSHQQGNGGREKLRESHGMMASKEDIMLLSAEEQHFPSTSELTGYQKPKEAGDLTMEDFKAYIEIIRQIVGREYVFDVDIVSIPRESDRLWINEHIAQFRPEDRLDKEFCGHFGLLLTDATQLPENFNILFSNLQALPPEITPTSSKQTPNAEVTRATMPQLTGDTYAIEIKAKQGWLLPPDFNDFCDSQPTTSPSATSWRQPSESISPCNTTPEIKNKVATLSTSPPTGVHSNKAILLGERHSGGTEGKVVHSEVEATSTNKSDARLSSQIDSRCRYCAMQYLKLHQGKTTRRSAYCPLDLFSGISSRMVKALDALLLCPQNNLRIFVNGNLVYGDHKGSLSLDALRETVFNSVSIDLVKSIVIQSLLREYSNSKEPIGVSHRIITPIKRCSEEAKSVAPGLPRSPDTATSHQGSPAANLPLNCILNKVLQLQLLAKNTMRYMHESGYGAISEKVYGSLAQLLQRNGEITVGNLSPEEQYLLGATALDCSIVVAFQELEDPRPDQRSFISKVCLLDLDPKPDSHLHKYLKQSEDIRKALPNER